jgi:hypothetical protein
MIPKITVVNRDDREVKGENKTTDYLRPHPHPVSTAQTLFAKNHPDI